MKKSITRISATTIAQDAGLSLYLVEYNNGEATQQARLLAVNEDDAANLVIETSNSISDLQTLLETKEDMHGFIREFENGLLGVFALPVYEHCEFIAPDTQAAIDSIVTLRKVV